MSEPVAYLVTKQPLDRVFGCPQLLAESVCAEDRNSSGLAGSVANKSEDTEHWTLSG